MLSHCCLTDLRKWLTKWAFIKWVIWLISSKLDFTTHVTREMDGREFKWKVSETDLDSGELRIAHVRGSLVGSNFSTKDRVSAKRTLRCNFHPDAARRLVFLGQIYMVLIDHISQNQLHASACRLEKNYTLTKDHPLSKRRRMFGTYIFFCALLLHARCTEHKCIDFRFRVYVPKFGFYIHCNLFRT